MKFQTLDTPLVEWEEGGNRLQGCYHLTNAEYHTSQALSPSSSGSMLKAPLIYAMNREQDNDPSAAMVDGSAIHAIVLEPERNLVPSLPQELQPTAAPERPALADGRAKAGTLGKELFLAWRPLNEAWAATEEKRNLARAEWSAELSPDAIMMHGKRRARIFGCANALAKMLKDEGVDLSTGLVEKCFFHTDEATGAYLRCKPDFFDPESGVIIDVKSARSAEGRAFKRQAADLGYFRLAAMQWDVLELLGYNVSAYIFAVGESEAPHLTQLFEYTDQDLDQGRRDWKRAAKLWIECESTGIWPGYPAGIGMLTIPGYLRDTDYDA